MLTVYEAVELLERNGIQTDSLAIRRWIHEKRLVGVRTTNGEREWLIPEEAIHRLARELLDEENDRLKTENEVLVKENKQLQDMIQALRRQLQDPPT